MGKKLDALVAVLLVVACIIVPVGAQLENRVYLVPQNSSALYGHTAEVELWINATEIQGGQIKLTYNPTCAKAIKWVNSSNFSTGGGWDHYEGEGMDWITFCSQKSLTGEYKIGTLTIQGVYNGEGRCETPLTLNTQETKLYGVLVVSQLKDDTGRSVTAKWIDGTFTCEGSAVIPEFSTIAIPVFVILGLLFVMRWRKRS